MVERETSLESCLLTSMGTVVLWVCLSPTHINNLIYKTLWIYFTFCAHVLFHVYGWLGATMWVLGKNAEVSGTVNQLVRLTSGQLSRPNKRTFLFVLVFKDRISLCRAGWTQTHGDLLLP